MLIQKRQPFKDGWPGYWDVSCGGSAVSGENSSIAAERELGEELGLFHSFTHSRPVLTVHFDDGFDDFYLVHKDLDPEELKLQPEEVESAAWASMDRILEMIEEGTFIPYRPEMIRLLFSMRTGRGTLQPGY